MVQAVLSTHREWLVVWFLQILWSSEIRRLSNFFKCRQRQTLEYGPGTPAHEKIWLLLWGPLTSWLIFQEARLSWILSKIPFLKLKLKLWNMHARTLWMCTSLHDLICILKASTSEQPPHYDSNDATVKRLGADFSTSHRRQPSVPQCFWMWVCSTCRSTARVQKEGWEDGIILVLIIWSNMIWNMQCFIVELRSCHTVMYH